MLEVHSTLSVNKMYKNSEILTPRLFAGRVF